MADQNRLFDGWSHQTNYSDKPKLRKEHSAEHKSLKNNNLSSAVKCSTALRPISEVFHSYPAMLSGKVVSGKSGGRSIFTPYGSTGCQLRESIMEPPRKMETMKL